MKSPAPLKPHPYKAFYDSVRQTATVDADDRPPQLYWPPHSAKLRRCSQSP